MRYFVALASLIGFGSTSAYAENDILPLHPVEAYCIDYEMRGSNRKGWLIGCSRKYGAESFSIEYYEDEGRGPGGETRTEVCHNHRIELKDKVYTFNLRTGEGYLDKNLIYPTRVAAAQALATEGTRDAYVRAFGLEPTGEKKEIIGRTCYEYKKGNASTCYSDDLILLDYFQPSSLGIRLTATSLENGRSGDDKNYRLFELLPFQETAEGTFWISKCTPKDAAVPGEAE